LAFVREERFYGGGGTEITASLLRLFREGADLCRGETSLEREGAGITTKLLGENEPSQVC